MIVFFAAHLDLEQSPHHSLVVFCYLFFSEAWSAYFGGTTRRALVRVSWTIQLLVVLAHFELFTSGAFRVIVVFIRHFNDGIDSPFTFRLGTRIHCVALCGLSLVVLLIVFEEILLRLGHLFGVLIWPLCHGTSPRLINQHLRLFLVEPLHRVTFGQRIHLVSTLLGLLRAI